MSCRRIAFEWTMRMWWSRLAVVVAYSRICDSVGGPPTASRSPRLRSSSDSVTRSGFSLRSYSATMAS